MASDASDARAAWASGDAITQHDFHLCEVLVTRSWPFLLPRIRTSALVDARLHSGRLVG